MWSNTYIIERFDQALLVDPSQDYDTIMKYTDGKMIVGVLLTHAHIDHTMLIDKFKCPIYIHEDEAYVLFDDNINGANMLGIRRNYRRANLNIITIKDKDIITLVDKTIEVIHTPGHTIGSVCYKIEDDLITGDTLFKGSVGRYDFPTGNNRQMKESLRKIFAYCKPLTRIYPGHDELSSLKEEMKNNEYYKRWVKIS
jgi:glyoxylase-like metal-dependent hydrolase (beta-lactamase superfamily II)